MNAGWSDSSALALGRTLFVDSSSGTGSSNASLVAAGVGKADSGEIVVSKPSKSQEEKLFDARAAAKIWTSRLAMHLKREVRDRIFLQLDRLHDIDEWVDDSKALSLDSYKTFIRWIIASGLDAKPNLALMPSGNLLAIWRNSTTQISIEFIANDRVKWLAKNNLNEGIERAAGETFLHRLQDAIRPFGSDGIFK